MHKLINNWRGKVRKLLPFTRTRITQTRYKTVDKPNPRDELHTALAKLLDDERKMV